MIFMESEDTNIATPPAPVEPATGEESKEE